MTHGDFQIGNVVYRTTLNNGVMSQDALTIENINGDMVSVSFRNMIGQRIESKFPSNELSKVKPSPNEPGVSMSNYPYSPQTIPSNDMPIGPF